MLPLVSSVAAAHRLIAELARGGAQLQQRLERLELLTMPKPTDDDLDNRFRYHRPSPEQVEQHAWVTETTLDLAKQMRDRLPEGRNLALVLTLLEEVRMRANAAIACGS